MRSKLHFCFILFFAMLFVDLAAQSGKLIVEGRYLKHEDGTPFFYLGDTNWSLLTTATREDAERLIKSRGEIGYTVMQIVVTGAYLKNEPIVSMPNVYGDHPFKDLDFNSPIITDGNDPDDQDQYDYWDHLEYIIELAKSYDIYVGLLPGWHKLYESDKINVGNAHSYGKWLASRYQNHTNIIWILGGDTRANSEEKRNMFDNMATGIKEVIGEKHLMTFHPIGGARSSDWFQNEPWLDFNMVQSGHSARNLPNYNLVSRVYDVDPPKPCMDAEPRYEDHSVNWNPENGWFSDWDVRQAAYWALFAGAHGHTYGARGIHQMYQPGRMERGPTNYYWYEAMDLDGSRDIKHVKDLILSREYFSRIPDQNIVINHLLDSAHIQATRGDGYAFIYSPLGESFEVDLSLLGAKNAITCWWYNPRDGICYNEKIQITHQPFTSIGEVKSSYSFDPPGEPQRGNDWVLVLDDSSKGYDKPGKTIY